VKQVLDDYLAAERHMQSYNNAAAMKRCDKRLQTLFQNINKYAEYVPWTAHSLNLVREKAASTVPEVVDYVGIL
jgi:ribosome-associated toxin RatA of RatAB toxin-antitoxin module